MLGKRHLSWQNWKGLLLGKALMSKDLEGEKLGSLWGIPIMASDAVSSVAYAIEEMLLVLVPVLGLAAAGYLEIVASPIILLVLVLAFSYSQVIANYPSGGGAYVVSAQNIGKGASMVAAAALIIGYIMTVAVGLSAASAAIVAAFAQFKAQRLLIALALLGLITLLNLRGMRESSKIIGIPTYAFILAMAALILTGLVKYLTGTLAPIEPAQGAQAAVGGAGAVSLFLLLRAFSSGCSALTGVEAVSNAVPSFRAPSQRIAQRVLFTLAGVVIFIFGGSVLLVAALRIIPAEGTTVISQMGAAIFGYGPMFYLLQFVTSLILLLAANTAYNGLPTLLAILAGDGCMPRQFMHRGARLGFSNGIVFISCVAGGLLIAFRAEVHHLIPLYSVSVFLSFTLSQVGMVARWRRIKGKGWRHKLLINGLGALMTATGTMIVFLTRFSEGSWALAIVIPAIALFMYRTERHYQFVAEQLRVDDFMAHYHKSVSGAKNLCIVLVGDMNRSVLKALNYANLISSNVVALHISVDDEHGERLQARWATAGIDVPLVLIRSPYRDLVGPVEDYIAAREADMRPGEMITAVLPRFMETRWLANLLHNQTAYFIIRRLRKHRNVATVMVPYIYGQR